MRLANKVAVITGAGHGIGRAYARKFAQEGASVVIADIDRQGGDDAAKALLDSSLSAWSRSTDVTSFDSVSGLARETVERYGRIDILVNNAAIYVTQKLWKGPVEDLDVDEWDRVIAVNLKGVFLCCKAVIPYMKSAARRKDYQYRIGNFFQRFRQHAALHHDKRRRGGVDPRDGTPARRLEHQRQLHDSGINDQRGQRYRGRTRTPGGQYFEALLQTGRNSGRYRRDSLVSGQ